MRVVVDQERCEGHGKCANAAPTVFELGDDDLSHVLIDDVPESLREQVERAIRLCPRQAIAWADVAATS